MKALIFDVETTGVDHETDEVIEAAGVLFSVDCVAQIAGFSFIMKSSGSNAAEHVNGISDGLLAAYGISQSEGWKRVVAWMDRADVIVAHNAAFDRAFCLGVAPPKPWVCTQDDVDWPRAAAGSKLTDIMLAHGLGVSHAHRAMVDCLNIARLFERCHELGHPPDVLLAKAMRPKKTYKALVTFANNALAKQHAFRWHPERKIWWRRIATDDLEAFASSAPFGIQEVTDIGTP